MPRRWTCFGVVALAGVATARPAAARTEISARVPIGVAIADSTRFELGLRSDLLYLFPSSDLGLGLTGEVRSGAREIGAAFAALENVHDASSVGPVFEAGYGSAGERRYLYGRMAYQFRVRLDGDDKGFAYALGSSLFVAARGTVSGPGAWEGVVGVEVGGGLIGMALLAMRSIIRAGG